MVFMTSTKGTWETTARKRSGQQVDDRAHQQSTGGAAFDGYTCGVAIAVGGEVLDTGDEVGEGVALEEHFAGVVPGFAKVGAAADMGVGHDDAAVEQAEAVGVEADRERVAVGAVAIDVKRVKRGPGGRRYTF